MGYEQVEAMFRGSHRHGPRWTAEDINRERVRQQCAPITVTADELAEAIDENGVNGDAAEDLIIRLLARAQDTAVARTLGVEEPAA